MRLKKDSSNRGYLDASMPYEKVDYTVERMCNIYLLSVLDTAGQEEFSAMREQYMRNGRGFMLVYSVTDDQSFENARKLYHQVLRVKDKTEYPVLLVANKVDLINHRKVSEQQGRALADELKLPYIETSAKDPPVNVDAAFHELVRIMKSFPVDDDADVSLYSSVNIVICQFKKFSDVFYFTMYSLLTFQKPDSSQNGPNSKQKGKKNKKNCSIM